MKPRFLPVGQTLAQAAGDKTYSEALQPLRQLVDLSSAEQTLRDIHDNRIATPTTLQELPYQHTFTSTLSVDLAVALGIPVGDVDARMSRRVFVQEYLKYAKIDSLRWGIGIRWLVNYKTVDAQAKTSSIALVAASAQFGFVQAEARFEVIGVDSARITELVAAPVQLDVETYQQMNDAFVNIKKLVWDAATIVRPQMVGVMATQPTNQNDYEEALGAGWGLTQVMQGLTLSDALRSSKLRSEIFDDAVRAIYTTVAELSDADLRPAAAAQARAKKILNGLRVV